MRADWIDIELGNITTINPKIKDKTKIDPNLVVQFVPMKLVDEVVDKIHLTETRKFHEVQKKSYTYFEEKDVLFAKVTPCMENGKVAVARNLKNGIGYGSSEFHVLRCFNGLNEKYLFFFLVQSSFRKNAQHAMTGAVGLRRVPKNFFENYVIPFAPLPEQRAIVEKIEKLLSDLDNGIANLKTAKDKLNIYRQSVLKKAFEGELTKDWREEKGYSFQTWKLIKLGEIAEIKRGKSKHRPRNDPKLFGGKYPFIQTGDVKAACGGNIFKYTQTYNEIGLAQSQLWPKGTLCLTIAANIADTAFLGLDACFPDSVVGIKSEDNVLSLQYLNYLIQKLKVEIDSKASATAQKNINVEFLNNLEIPLATIEEQNAVVEAIESRLSACDKLAEDIDQGLEKTEALRQSILKKAFSGELLSEEELEACRREPYWEPADKLLGRIK